MTTLERLLKASKNFLEAVEDIDFSLISDETGESVYDTLPFAELENAIEMAENEVK